jgi:RluA family pseudouridine synthase
MNRRTEPRGRSPHDAAARRRRSGGGAGDADVAVVRVGPRQAGARLDRVVAEALGTSTSAARRLAVTGAVRRNGARPPSPTVLLREGDRLVVDLAALPPAPARVELSEREILYEDAWLVAFDKPAGLPSHATVDPARPHLVGLATAVLAARGPAPYLGVHHRLDRDTSGFVLFTKQRAANAAVAALFAERRIDKTYVARCAGPGHEPATWSVRDHLAKIGRAGKVNRYGAVRSGGEPAHTDLRLLGRSASGADRWLVEARPRTGRTHQVRVHLASSGLPIVGDVLYGGPPAPRVLLHAERLRFAHPFTGDDVVITSPAPGDIRG